MTALAEALLAAQRQAIGALGKSYVAGNLSVEGVSEQFEAIGCTDVVDSAQLLAAWDVLREYGAPAPAETRAEPKPENEPASEAQMKYASDLAHERAVTLPDYPLTKASASKLIEQLKGGTYLASEWEVAF